MNCEKCQGECWDETRGKYWNNGKTKEGKQKPRWRCKNKDGCGWVKYDDAPAAPAGNLPGSTSGARPLGPLYRDCLAVAKRIAKVELPEASNEDLRSIATTLFIAAKDTGAALMPPPVAKTEPAPPAKPAVPARNATTPDRTWTSAGHGGEGAYEDDLPF